MKVGERTFKVDHVTMADSSPPPQLSHCVVVVVAAVATVVVVIASSLYRRRGRTTVGTAASPLTRRLQAPGSEGAGSCEGML